MPCRNNPIPVYPALEFAISINGVKKWYVAEKLKINNKTLSGKLTGKYDFTMTEAFLIADMFPDVPIRELFKKNEQSI